MSEIKLSKLPERTPVKLTITLHPELNRDLCEYSNLYQATYGAKENITDLIPFMLESFLASDRAFKRHRKT